MPAYDVAALTASLVSIVGAERVLSAPAAQKRFLKDFSWYSPLLAAALENMQVDAVVRPRTIDELREIVGLAVRARVPITLRGAGTGNYGQSLPLDRGILIDGRGPDRILDVTPNAITVEPGAVLLQVERAARAIGRELRVMPSTYHIATAAGFICGGSGGIGSVEYGGIWDGNVLRVELLTAEEPPRTLQLAGHDADVVLHTYGTVGIVTSITFPLAEAHDWHDAYVRFDTFDAAARFAWRVAADNTIRKRLTSLQEAPLPSMFEPVKRFFTEGSSAVLLIVEEKCHDRVAALADAYRGELHDWPDKPPITQFPFSHTILWAKKHDPSSTWIQGRFSPDEETFFAQVAALKRRFGDRFLVHAEFHRTSSNDGIWPSSISVIADPEPAVLDDVIQFSEQIGVSVMNPHSYVVQEGGMVEAIDDVLAFKRGTDPFGLLNPGKVERRFYEPVGQRV